jgi:hypothetical protein
MPRSENTRAGIARLEHPPRIGHIGALALPQRRGDADNLRCAARLAPSSVGDEHRAVIEKLGERFAVAEHEGVLQQRLELLWCAGSRSYAPANLAPACPRVCPRKLVFPRAHWTPRSARERIVELAGQGHGLVPFWREATGAIAPAVPSTAHPPLDLAPASLLVTSHDEDGLLEIPHDWLANEYYQDDSTKMADVARSERAVSTLHRATGGDPSSPKPSHRHPLERAGQHRRLTPPNCTRLGRQPWRRTAVRTRSRLARIDRSSAP